MTGQEEVTGPRLDLPGERSVKAAAQLLIANGLAADDSIFTPGRAVWTDLNADALVEAFVDRPDLSSDSFMTKLQTQLADAPSAARQLMAELLFVNLLPLSDYYPATKRELINKVLAWCTDQPQLPKELSEGLEAGGVFNGGVAFKTGRWQQLSFLVQFVRYWKNLPAVRRDTALRDGWAFRDAVMSAPGPKVPAQRNSLLYLIFPEVFHPIVSNDHKRRIRAAFREYLDAPTADLDRDIATILAALNAENGTVIDIYDEPWASRWRPSKENPASAADDSVMEASEQRRAWLVRGGNVNGRNLVPTWLARGSCSVAASHLRAIDSPLTREELRPVVEADYSHVSYNAREEKLTELDAFMNRITEGDWVLTVSEGAVYLGSVIAPAIYVKSADDRSNLRRNVAWLNSTAPVDANELAAPLQARLSSQHTVVDLTNEISDLEALAARFTQAPTPAMSTPGRAELPDATEALADELLMPRDWLQECIDLLRDRPQLIFYGPPGTGKTYIAQRLAEHLAGRDGVKLVQFHPAYSYEDFFEGYRPAPSADGAASVGFRLTPGPFRRLVDAARENPASPYVLIIDEINRANLAKVFGELYFLLEYRDRAIDLLYAAGDEAGFTLPANVFILGTMNTADRSIALIDAAMRRRFAFVELHPSDEPTAGLLRRWLAREQQPDEAADILDRLNNLIDDPEFKIGPSYFMRPAIHENGGLDRTWRSSILPLLEEHHYGETLEVAKRYSLDGIRGHLRDQAEPVGHDPADAEAGEAANGATPS